MGLSSVEPFGVVSSIGSKTDLLDTAFNNRLGLGSLDDDSPDIIFDIASWVEVTAIDLEIIEETRPGIKAVAVDPPDTMVDTEFLVEMLDMDSLGTVVDTGLRFGVLSIEVPSVAVGNMPLVEVVGVDLSDIAFPTESEFEVFAVGFHRVDCEKSDSAFLDNALSAYVAGCTELCLCGNDGLISLPCDTLPPCSLGGRGASREADAMVLCLDPEALSCNCEGMPMDTPVFAPALFWGSSGVSCKPARMFLVLSASRLSSNSLSSSAVISASNEELQSSSSADRLSTMVPPRVTSGFTSSGRIPSAVWLNESSHPSSMLTSRSSKSSIDI
jgi:hypothetical protein